MWYCGDVSTNIPPYKFLGSKDVKHIRGCHQKLSMMRYVMKCMERGVRNMGYGEKLSAA